jgi:hypothetical protein
MDKFYKLKELISKDIVKIKVNYTDFNLKDKVGEIEVHKSVKDEVQKIFNEIKESGFIIEKVETIDNYNYDDEESVIANNTSGFNFRFVSGTNKLSDHSVGLAIDINPKLNPWIHPSALSIFDYDTEIEGTIIDGGPVVNIFKKYGWSWGGYWKNPDYQHFFKGGEINKEIKKELYKKAGYNNMVLNFKDFLRKVKNKIK